MPRHLSVNLRNAAPQQLVSVIVDVSGSMYGDPIDEVKRGALQFKTECSADPALRSRLQVQFGTFGGGVRLAPFVPIAAFEPPVLRAGGDTPLAEAVLAAIEATDEHTTLLRRAAELEVYKPLYFLSSDGEPTSSEESLELAAQKIRRYEETKRGEFYGFGVDADSVQALQPLFVRQVESLPGVSFTKFFDIISASVYHVSRRAVGEEPDLRHIIHGFLRGGQDADNA
jgi:uncharacterized protein YegL